MRQAADKGLSGLLDDLEPLRERATVQKILAEKDLKRRFEMPRLARLQAAKEAGSSHALALSHVNGYLTRALEGLEEVPGEAFAHPVDRGRLQELLARASRIVAAEETARA